MEPLTSEASINKNGVSVIKHIHADQSKKQTGFLSWFMPRLPVIPAGYIKVQNERRAELLETLKEDLLWESVSRKEAKRSLIEATSDHRLREMQEYLFLNAMMYGESELSREYEKLEAYSSGTLETLHEVFHGSGEMAEFLSSAPKKDSQVKDAIVFRNCDLSPVISENFIYHIRESTGITELYDINENSNEHRRVSAVFRVAIEAVKRRKVKQGAESFSGGWYMEEYDCKQMTPELADVIMDHPERSDDIVEYMDSRHESIPAQTDSAHLRLYLENSAVALSDGVL